MGLVTVLSPSLCPGVICSNGQTWRQQRRFCLKTLRELGLGKQVLEVQLQREAAELAKVFDQEQGMRKWAYPCAPPHSCTPLQRLVCVYVCAWCMCGVCVCKRVVCVCACLYMCMLYP